MWAYLLAIFLLSLLPESSSFGSKVIYLRPDEPHIQDVQTGLLPMLYFHNSVYVFCKEATPPSLWNVFQSSRLHLMISVAGDYKQYKATSIQEVYQAHYQEIEDFEGKPLGMRTTTRHRIITLCVHNDAYYGISTKNNFVLTLEEIPFDLERVAQFTFALALWATCPLLEDSLLLAYCSAAALGAHLAGVVVILGAILASGEEPNFARLFPLKANFKQVYEERPTLVILTLLCGAWLFQAGARKVSFLWRYRSIRFIHCRLLRIVAYQLILYASDYRQFGRICAGMLLSWPESWHLFQFLKFHYTKFHHTKWSQFWRKSCDKNRRSGRNMPRHFARVPTEDHPVRMVRSSPNFLVPGAAYDGIFNDRRLLRRHQERQDLQWLIEDQDN